MAMIGENQVRHMYVAGDYPGHTTTALVKAGAIGDLAVLESDGTAVAAGKEFALFLKNWKGELTTSDKIHPSRVTYGKSIKYSARVPKIYTITDIAVPVAGALYTVQVIIQGYGSLSVENEYIKEAFYKAKTGDNAEAVVDGLIKSLARNFSREQPATDDTFTYTPALGGSIQLPDNLMFSFEKTGSTTTAGIKITEKSTWLEKYYTTGKKDKLEIPFIVNVRFPGAVTVTNTQVGSLGTGTGYQVRNMEYYFLGNRQDSYRGAGYPHNFPEHYDSSLTGQYHIVELEYWDESRDDPKKSKKQVTIVIEDAETGGESDYPTVNALIADLNTAIGGANGVVIADIT